MEDYENPNVDPSRDDEVIIGRYTTDIITINVPLDLTYANVYVTFYQNGKIILDKQNDEINITSETIEVPLTQEDTSKFMPGYVTFEIRYIFADGSSDFSNTMGFKVNNPIKGGVLNYVSSQL